MIEVIIAIELAALAYAIYQQRFVMFDYLKQKKEFAKVYAAFLNQE